MIVALARPQGTIDVPRQEGTVILAFDISASMSATDLKPTRMAAAVTAATDFVDARHRHEPVAVEAVLNIPSRADLGHSYELYAPHA